MLIGVWYSFTNWNFTRADFVGLMNYKNIISDPSIKRALLNTIIFTVVTTVGKVGLGLALAVFLNRKLHLRNYLRGISFFPFDIIVATTNGGPGVTTQVMNTMIYRSFSFNMQGEANAGYVLLAVIVALFAVSSYSIIRKREVDL